VKVSPKGSWGR
jgi:hypothetical protein